MIKNFYNGKALLGSSLAAVMALQACGGAGKAGENGAEDSDSLFAMSQDDFHADNDIAMTLGSIADAIRVGEALDSATYSYAGVLTDGVGRPLYTDVDGTPGMWSVRVVSPTDAVISTTDVGDLPASELENYIVTSLGLGAPILVRDSADDTYRLYSFSDTEQMSVESHVVTNPIGIQGTQMTIGIWRFTKKD